MERTSAVLTAKEESILKQFLLLGLVVLMLVCASELVVVVYRSDRDTTDWVWRFEDSGLEIAIGFDQKQWIKHLESLGHDFERYFYYDQDNMIPILAYLGKCPTGGYDINIDRIEKIDQDTIITISRRSPRPDEYVSMAFTYPYSYLLIERELLINDNLIVVDQNGKILAEYLNAFPNEERNVGKLTIIH